MLQASRPTSRTLPGTFGTHGRQGALSGACIAPPDLAVGRTRDTELHSRPAPWSPARTHKPSRSRVPAARAERDIALLRNGLHHSSDGATAALDMGVGVGRNLLMVFLLWLRWATAPHELLWLLWLGLLWLRPSFLHRWPSLLWRAFNLHSRLVLAPPPLGRELRQGG